MTKELHIRVDVKVNLMEFILDFNNCYTENTFDLNETLINIIEFVPSITANNYDYGKVYTYFNPQHRISGNNETHFILYPNESYYIMVHDPKYFLMTLRPQIYPGIVRKYEVGRVNTL